MKKELKNSIDYLNTKTAKNSGFSVPTDYFTELEEAVFTEISTTSFSSRRFHST